MRLLLIYQFGGSDLQLVGETAPRHVDLGERVQRILSIPDLLMRWKTGSQHEIELCQGETSVARFPILGDTVSFLRSQNASEICLQPILTRQEPPQKVDTIALMPLLECLQDKWCEDGVAFRLLPAWIATEPGFDYAKVARFYREQLYPQYKTLARGSNFDRRLFQVTPGTPAMSMASAIFAQDPGLEFLYTPMGDRTRSMTLFGDERRKQTDSLLEELLKRLEWRAVAAALEQEGNGYTPVAGPHPLGQNIRLARALDAWLRRSYQEACQYVLEEEANESLDAFATMCRILAPLSPGAPQEKDWSAIWKWAMVDAFNRLLVTRYLGDLAGFVLALYGFNDACLLWGLSQKYPGVDFREKLPPNVRKELTECVGALFPEFGGETYSETDKVRALLAITQKHKDDDLSNWLECYLVLHWVLNNGIDEIRNLLVHGAIHLVDAVLDDQLKSLGIQSRVSGLDQIVFFTRHILTALPGKPSCPCPVGLLSDRSRFAGQPPSGMMTPLETDGMDVIAGWIAARANDIRSKEDHVRSETEQLRVLFQARLHTDFPHDSQARVLGRLDQPVSETVNPLYLAHKLVPALREAGGEPSGILIGVLLCHLASAESPFKTMWEYGSRNKYRQHVGSWLRGEQTWKTVLAGYVKSLQKSRSASERQNNFKKQVAPTGSVIGETSRSPQDNKIMRGATKVGKSKSKRRSSPTAMRLALERALDQKGRKKK